MTNIRNWINLVENIDKEREFYINQANHYRTEERAKWWPVSKELMAKYNDGSHTRNVAVEAGDAVGWLESRLIHRDGDKPAVIGVDGFLMWYKNGLRHRLAGPAVIDSNNKFEWWFKGKKISVKSQEEYLQWLEKNGHIDVYRLRKQ